MTSADVLGVLVETAVAMSAAIALSSVARKPLRRWFGAAAAYSIWGTVPVAIVAVLLPAMAVPAIRAPVGGDLLAVGMPLPLATPAIIDGSWWVAAWLCGAIAMAIRLGLQQRAFVRSLGDLHPRRDGTLQAASVAGLPALVGLLRPSTIVPADFDTRYTPEQQALLRTHEREHLAGGDPWANALLAALHCVYWFNPLMPLAARCFRHDQELACDQRVLAAIPGSRRAYGEAMFDTQLAAQPLPLGCHWGFGHPLKERIAMLKESLPSPARRIAGGALVATLVFGSAFAAWASQPPQAEAEPDLDWYARKVSTPAPAYPEAARTQRISGTVTLIVDIAADGSVSGAEVDRGEPAGVFDDAALAAVANWKFQPAMKDGKAVSSRVRVPIAFKIPPKAEKAD